MARVRTHKVRRDGKTHVRQQHDRRTRGGAPTAFTFQPKRSARNAGRSFMAWKHRRRAVACGLAGLAVGEIVGFVTFKAAGGILLGVGLVLGLLGAGLLARS